MGMMERRVRVLHALRAQGRVLVLMVGLAWVGCAPAIVSGEGMMAACSRPKPPVIIGGPPVESASCKRLRHRLERLQARLRAGYREPEGFRLREQRRRLSDQWLSSCFP